MKQTLFYQILGIAALLLLLGNVQGQTLVNKEWAQSNGIPDSIAFSASTLDSQENLIVTSNAITAGQQANLLVMKYDKDGNLLWQDTYNGAINGKDYGIALTTDNSNNIYVAGASQTNSISSDYIIRKYDELGVLQWSSTYSGSGVYNAPTAICVDNSGNVFVTGATFSLGTQTDYATLKFDSNGVQQWVETYNYANLYDVPAGIEVGATGNVYVTGASASSNNNYDYATVEYDASTGNQLNVSRVTAPGSGFDKATAMARDNTGNLYITGSAFETATNSYDIKTIKLNSSLVVQWIKTYDKTGLEDAGTTIGMDNNGNVFVGGYVTTPNEGANFITLKYDPLGNLLWEMEYNCGEFSKEDKIVKLVVDDGGNVTVTGESENDSDKDILLLKYTEDGILILNKKYENVGMDSPTDVKANANGDVYVTGKVYDGTNTTNTSIKYSLLDKNTGYESDSQGVAIYLKNQLIVSFDSSVVDRNTVDNLDIQFGTLDRFLKPIAISQLQSKLNIDPQKCKIVRVHKRLTSQITYSISRLGDTISMPPFWTTFVLVFSGQLPQGKEIAYCDSLKTLFPMVEYAHLNGIAQADNGIPNDNYYADQKYLYPSLSNLTEKGINAEKVWDEFGVTGESFLKVGIFDTGAKWNHEDFTYSGFDPQGNPIILSKVQGWDFEENSSIQTSSTPEGYSTSFGSAAAHGTNATGIIGALRNNNMLGIAGIAGGDNDPNTGVVGSGVSLYAMKIRAQSAAASGSFFTLGYAIDYIIDAIEISATYNPTYSYGYGLHIMNHSWGIDDVSPTPPTANPYYTANYESLRASVKYAYQNAVIFVASRGNKADDREHIPATYPDDWVMNVTGSSSLGRFKFSTDMVDIHVGAGNWQPNWGKNVDITAPCVHTLVQRTTDVFDLGGGTSLDIYGEFLGTSASAPQVSGAAALLLSYHNPVPTPQNLYPYENLAPEDVEYLMQASAVDDDPALNGYIPGYDDFNGYGRLDIYAAMKMIEKPHKDILHFGQGNNLGYVLTYGQFGSYPPYPTINLTENYKDINGQSYAAGSYLADVYEIQALVTHNLPANYNIIDKWARNSFGRNLMNIPSLSNLLPLYDINSGDLQPDEKAVLFTANNTSAELRGYCYRLGHETSPGSGIYVWDGWIPFNPLGTGVEHTKVEYSLYINDGTVAINEENTSEEVSVYPNPAHEKNTIRLATHLEKEVEIELYDAAGRNLKSIYKGKVGLGQTEIHHNISTLSQGIYYYKITSEGGQNMLKFIKY